MAFMSSLDGAVLATTHAHEEEAHASRLSDVDEEMPELEAFGIEGGSPM